MNSPSSIAPTIPDTFAATLQTYLDAPQAGASLDEMETVFTRVQKLQAAWKSPTYEQAERAIALLQELKEKYDGALNSARALYSSAYQQDDRIFKSLRPRTEVLEHRHAQRTYLDSRATAVTFLLDQWQAKQQKILKESERLKKHSFHTDLPVDDIKQIKLLELNRGMPELGTVRVVVDGEHQTTILNVFGKLHGLLGINDPALAQQRARTFSDRAATQVDPIDGDIRDIRVLAHCTAPMFMLMPLNLAKMCTGEAYEVGEPLNREVDIHKIPSGEIVVSIFGRLTLPCATVDATLTSTLTPRGELSHVHCMYNNVKASKNITLEDIDRLKVSL